MEIPSGLDFLINKNPDLLSCIMVMKSWILDGKAIGIKRKIGIRMLFHASVLMYLGHWCIRML